KPRPLMPATRRARDRKHNVGKIGNAPQNRIGNAAPHEKPMRNVGAEHAPRLLPKKRIPDALDHAPLIKSHVNANGDSDTRDAGDPDPLGPARRVHQNTSCCCTTYAPTPAK